MADHRESVLQNTAPMHLNERVVLTGAILFGLGLVAGIAIGSATAVSALTQGAPDALQSWSGVVAMP